MDHLFFLFVSLYYYIDTIGLYLSSTGLNFSFLWNSRTVTWIWKYHQLLHWHGKYVRFQFCWTILLKARYWFASHAVCFLEPPQTRHQEEDLRRGLSLAEPHKSSDLFSERFEYHHVTALIKSWWPCLLDLCHMAPCLSIGVHTC